MDGPGAWQGSRSSRPPGDHPAWLVALAGLAAWQAWLTLALFGAGRDPGPLVDDRPVVSGRHPLHLYHGTLGARALRRGGTLSCYDPAFHAGYPKTPVFDGGSRPAELTLALAGSTPPAAAYKVGLALAWAAVPLWLYLGARGAGLGRAAAVLAAALGQLVWWGGPCREALEAGDVDLLLASLLTATQAGLLLAYHRAPGPANLLGVIVTGFGGWFAHPLLLVLLLPLFLLYYVSVGTRHGMAWHVALLGGLLGAIGANLFWLHDWVGYWWIREPLRLDGPLLAHRTVRTILGAPLWGGPADRALALVLFPAALAGVLHYNQTGRRAAARLYGLAAAGFLALAITGIAAEPVGRFGAARLIVPALLFAVVPAAHALAGLAVLARRAVGATGMLAAGLSAAVVVAAVAPAREAIRDCWGRPQPLRIGLTADQEAIVAMLRDQTTDAARVLWEDRRGPRCASYWTVLLPLLTGRAFVGGLDPDAGIEHAACGLCDGVLAGRPLRDWTDAELRDYAARYNIGWVAASTPAARARFAAWPDAAPAGELPGGAGRLFALKRQPSYALVGTAVWRRADPDRIVLDDVVPQDGEVILSLHYQTGLRASPSRVEVERHFDPNDTIAFVRLRLAEPAARVTLTWQRR
jgi:hypothetical protein